MLVTGTVSGVYPRLRDPWGNAGRQHWALGEQPADPATFTEDVRQALYASKIVAYACVSTRSRLAAPIRLGHHAATGHHLSGGCIIRAKFLNHIKEP